MSPHRDHYDTELQYVAAELQRLFTHLEASGQYDDTLIILTGDHIELFDEHHRLPWTSIGAAGRRLPGLQQALDGGGHLSHLGQPPFEGLVHVPRYIKYPEQTGAGNNFHDQVELIDILPTILNQTDIQISQTVQGQPLHPDQRHNKRGLDSCVRSEVVVDPSNGHFKLVRFDTHKFIYTSSPSSDTARSYPLTFTVRRLLTPRTVLVERPSESDKVLDENPSIAEHLSEQLDAWATGSEVQSHTSLTSDKRDELENRGHA